ncbi:MAG: AMIN domain-containing protein, partial [Deltaproteobacteria bacterium]|nr:AMIN domain-containing protein [Deltaproteobacteria bacterium]
TANQQSNPKGLLFYFPDTALDIGKRNYSPPNNGIIWSIKTGEILEDKVIKSRIFIALKGDTPYELTPAGEEIQVAFSKATAISNESKTRPKSAAKNQKPKPHYKNVPTATRLKTVTATPLQNNIVVKVEADGTVKNFNSFTINKPAKIVFDLYRIKSPFKGEQKIAVDSRWLKQIRYFEHPDKVRIVLETHEEYLQQYSAFPTATGLLVHVGDSSTVTSKAGQINKKNNLGTKQVTLAWDKVSNATSYNVYLSTAPGVTRQNGFKISDVKNNHAVVELKRGATYYFVVTAVNQSGESNESGEISFTVGE